MADSHIQVRQNLQQRLLSAVKQCQKYFGANAEDVGTEGDMRVSALCSEWEAVLVHGMKRARNRTRGLNKPDPSSSTGGVSMWPVVSSLLSNEEIQRFNKLTEVTTDIGKGRAWLRAALNERTLEDYLHTLLSNRPHLQEYYEAHAFLLDIEKSAILPTIAAGLSSIIFSLSIDSEHLNTPFKTVDFVSVPVSTTPSSTLATETPPPPRLDFGSRVSDRVLREDYDDDVIAVKKDKKKKAKKQSHKSPSPQPPLAPPPQPLVPTMEQSAASFQSMSDVSTDTPISSTTPTHYTYDNSNKVSANSNHDNLNPFNDEHSLTSTPSVNSLTSIGDDVVSNVPLFNAPASLQEKSLIDNDSMGTLRESQAAIEATSMVLAATGEHQRTSIYQYEEPETFSSSSSSMSPQEMKEALKALVRSKNDQEETNRRLEAELGEEKSLTAELREELVKLKEEMSASRESHAHQSQGLERENDLLREQLKRYVGMVQQQEDIEQHKDLSTKLSEMAEMYGELMEFNDRLHKDVYSKDSVITKLCQALLVGGLEIPVSSDQLPRDATHLKKVVDIWVPSVIRRDKGGHHVYQIFVTLGNEEWNVYRRFAEFHEFHQQMMKSIDGIEEFPFPPKKAIGSKAAQVVEERRGRLQEYLRFVVEVCSRPSVKRKDGRVTKPILNHGTTKEDFIRIFPFFKSESVTPVSSSAGAGKSRPPLTKAPSYSGL